MTIKGIEGRVSAIAAVADDPEIAHQWEDRLYVDVLTAIAVDEHGASALARAALEAKDLRFPRWYA